MKWKLEANKEKLLIGLAWIGLAILLLYQHVYYNTTYYNENTAYYNKTNENTAYYNKTKNITCNEIQIADNFRYHGTYEK